MARKVSKKQRKSVRKTRVAGKSGPGRIKELLPYLVVLVAITLAAMWPVVHADFAEIDDQRLVIERTGSVIAQDISVFKPDLYSPHYKPLVYLTWIWETKLFGLDETVVHVNNLLLHILNTVLIFLITLRLAREFEMTKARPELVAMATGVIFGVHPMHVESVAWAVERKDVLYTFFFLLGLLSYFRYTDNRRMLWMGITSLLFGASILSKAPAIVFPFILILLDYALQRKPGRGTIVEKWPVLMVFLAGLFIYGVFGDPRGNEKNTAGNEAEIINLVSERQVTNVKPISDMPPFYGKIALIGLKGTFWYVHTFFPLRLSIAYPYKTWLPAIGHTIHILPVLLIAAGIMLFRIRKRLRFVFFTNAFFFIALGPALVRTGLGRGIFLSDRYVYLASYGLIFLLTGLLHWLMERKNWELKRQYLVYGIVAAIYGGMCFSYASKWDNGETLWTNTIDKYPSVSYAWVNRAKYYKDLGMHDKAMEDYSAALEIEDDLNGLIDRGIMLRDQGRYNESMADFERALAAKPDNEFALNGKGNLLFVMGRYQEAVEVYDKGIALYPGALSFLINRSAAYFYLGQVQSALSDLQRAQEINPGYPGINQKKTVMYMTIGDWNNAVASARLTAQEDPTNHANFGDLGQALQELGRHQEAIEAYTNAIQLNRQGKRYYQGRALSYSAVGNSQAASNDRQTARSL